MGFSVVNRTVNTPEESTKWQTNLKGILKGDCTLTTHASSWDMLKGFAVFSLPDFTEF